MRLALALLCTLAVAAAADLDAVRKEPDLEKRSGRALDAAAEALKAARALPAEGGSVTELEQDLDAMVGGVELSLQALHETGKKPQKLGRAYKRGELKTREMLRQLENLIQAIGFDNRPPAERARDRLVTMHEEYLFGVMSGR
jgi:hypothetical protein